MIIIGLMSGTSADGIDAAVVEIGDAIEKRQLDWRLLAHITLPYSVAVRQEIFACMSPQTGSVNRICALNVALGQAFADAAIRAAQVAQLSLKQIDLIGSHGQTLWHIPGQATLQIGCAASIAERTGITTVSNFRARDIAAGGQGAPLVAYVDALLCSHPNKSRALQNIGGIANVTFLQPGSSAHIAFDTGPGNMLIDDAARRITHGEWHFDRDGALAAQGTINTRLLAWLMAHPYLQQHPPKTTGRELFGAQYGEEVWQHAGASGIQEMDVIVTLTAFTATSIAQAYRQFLPTLPDEVVISGGGARNPVLMQALRTNLPECAVRSLDEIGIPAEAKEALAFAILAYLTIQQRPGNLPSATGATHPVVLGDITPGVNFCGLLGTV